MTGQRKQHDNVGLCAYRTFSRGRPVHLRHTNQSRGGDIGSLAYHWDAEEIQRQHPGLTLGQLHSALAYYYDHQEELDREIDKGLREVAQIRASLGTSPIRLKLRAKGLLP